jgi:hypothetical protein
LAQYPAADIAGPPEPFPLGEYPQSPYYDYDVYRPIGNDRFTSTPAARNAQIVVIPDRLNSTLKRTMNP